MGLFKPEVTGEIRSRARLVQQPPVAELVIAQQVKVA